ncbi:MAG: hypothetical protein Q9M10_07540, partial [Mariprofundaceae bacterium]|nr:hypothetical protein [Mariprofundaceae bacterium]
MSSFILSLEQGQVAHCLPTGKDSLTLRTSQATEPLYFSGTFADAIFSLQTTSPHTHRLQHIEQAYPHLQGLSQASCQSAQAKQLLLGESLGMLFVELTSKCNERCLHCYAESTPERQDFLNFDEVHITLQQARQLGRPFVQFTGGDP